MIPPSETPTSAGEGQTTPRPLIGSSKETDIQIADFRSQQKGREAQDSHGRRRGLRSAAIFLLLTILILSITAATLLTYGTLFSVPGAIREYQQLVDERNELVRTRAGVTRWADFEKRSRAVARRYAERFRAKDHAKLDEAAAQIVRISEKLWPELLACGRQNQSCEPSIEIERILKDLKIDKVNSAKRTSKPGT